MRKKAFLIPILTIVAAFALLTALTWANSAQPVVETKKTDPNVLLEQANKLMNEKNYADAEKIYLQIKAENPGSDKALEAQKQIIHMAIAQKDQKKADATFDSMVAEFSKNKNISEAIHRIGREYKEFNKEKAFTIHRYNVENFTDDIHAMWSQVEIIQMYIEDGNSAADAETDKMINTFKDQPTLAKEIYQLAGKYNYASKRTKANTLYAHASEYSPDDMYVQLSQIYCDIQNKDSNAVDTHLASIMEKHAGNSKLSKEIYNTAVNCGYEDKHDYAVEFYQQFIYSWPEDKQVPHAIQRMAIEHSKLGDETNADLAIEKLKNDYGDYSKKSESFFRLGQYYREDKNMYDKAAKLYEHGANNCPKDDDHTMFCQVELVKYYIRTGDPNKGNEQYNKLITEYKDKPSLPSNMCFIGDTYLRAGDANTANTLYTDVLKKWPDDPQTIFAKAGQAKIYAHLALYEDSNEVIDEIFTDYTDNPSIAEAIFGIGDDYLTLGNTERRKTYIEQKLGDGFIYNMPGLSKEARNLYSKAKDVFEKLVDKQYDSVYTGQAEFWVGEAYNTLGLYQEAIQTYTTFVDKWPNFEISWIAQDRIIKIYYRMLLIDKNMTESESDEMLLNAYKKLVDRFPDCPIAEEAKRSVESYTKEIQQKGELK